MNYAAIIVVLGGAILLFSMAMSLAAIGLHQGTMKCWLTGSFSSQDSDQGSLEQ